MAGFGSTRRSAVSDKAKTDLARSLSDDRMAALMRTRSPQTKEGKKVSAGKKERLELSGLSWIDVIKTFAHQTRTAVGRAATQFLKKKESDPDWIYVGGELSGLSESKLRALFDKEEYMISLLSGEQLASLLHTTFSREDLIARRLRTAPPPFASKKSMSVRKSRLRRNVKGEVSSPGTRDKQSAFIGNLVDLRDVEGATKDEIRENPVWRIWFKKKKKIVTTLNLNKVLDEVFGERLSADEICEILSVRNDSVGSTDSAGSTDSVGSTDSAGSVDEEESLVRTKSGNGKKIDK